MTEAKYIFTFDQRSFLPQNTRIAILFSPKVNEITGITETPPTVEGIDLPRSGDAFDVSKMKLFINKYDPNFSDPGDGTCDEGVDYEVTASHSGITFSEETDYIFDAGNLIGQYKLVIDRALACESGNTVDCGSLNPTVWTFAETPCVRRFTLVGLTNPKFFNEADYEIEMQILFAQNIAPEDINSESEYTETQKVFFNVPMFQSSNKLQVSSCISEANTKSVLIAEYEV